MVAEPVDHGGVATFPLAVWVRYQFGQLFQTVLKEKLQFTGVWVEQLESWARNIGLSLNPNLFPYVQLAVVSWSTELAASILSDVFTAAVKSARAVVGGSARLYAILAQCTVSQFNESHVLFSLPPTWLPVYQAIVPYVISLPIQDLPRAWVKPGTKMLTFMQPLDAPQKRQEPRMWEQLEKLKMLEQQEDFVRKALWKKVTLGTGT